MVSRDEERMRAKDTNRQHEEDQNIDGEERQSVEKATRLSARLIYEVIRRDGADEMTRPKTSLVFSGLAAGILIAFSVLGEAVFHVAIPDTPWRAPIESLGYTLGFLLVIMGRMQLFTENTITTVLPLTSQPCKEFFYLTGRLWTIVLVANVIGAFISATFMAHSGAFGPDMQEAFKKISEHAILHPPLEGFAKAIPAGVIVAAIVWMLPTVPRAPFLVIFTFTWLIAAGGFTHVIAGSVEMAYLLVTGAIGLPESITFFFPVLLGNIVGGTVVFTLITWAQVAVEVEE